MVLQSLGHTPTLGLAGVAEASGRTAQKKGCSLPDAVLSAETITISNDSDLASDCSMIAA